MKAVEGQNIFGRGDNGIEVFIDSGVVA